MSVLNVDCTQVSSNKVVGFNWGFSKNLDLKNFVPRQPENFDVSVG